MQVLEDYMKRHGVMPVDVAQALGVYPQTIYYWLNGQRRPSRDNAKKLAEWTNNELTVQDILGRT